GALAVRLPPSRSRPAGSAFRLLAPGGNLSGEVIPSLVSHKVSHTLRSSPGGSAMAFRDYERFDMMGLAELIAKRAVTAREVLDAAIERIDRWNPKVNAVVQRMDDEARRQVDGGLPSGPLSGAPYMLKDLYQPYT